VVSGNSLFLVVVTGRRNSFSLVLISGQKILAIAAYSVSLRRRQAVLIRRRTRRRRHSREFRLRRLEKTRKREDVLIIAGF
jgi:hypothetical protein